MSVIPRNRKTILFLLASLLGLTANLEAAAPAAQASAQTPAVTLKVGDQAPAFTPGTWIKGDPLKGLAKGNIYVLEFWATWCGPCKAAIPHVSKLAKQYAGKVTFIGVNVLETGKTFEEKEQKVAKFVKEQGEAMAYSVCRDTADEVVHKNWLVAAGLQGIPATFIVDGTGRIVWQGHPMSMDPVLEKVVAGTWNPQAEQVAAQANKKAEEAIIKALQAKNWQGAMDLLPSFKIVDSVSEAWSGFFRFQATVHLDPKAAAEMLDKVVKEKPFAEVQYYATILVREEGLSKEWYAKAAAIFSDLVKKEPAFYGQLAKAQFKAGDFKAAVVSKELELKDVVSRRENILKEHPDAEAQIKAYIEKVETELKEYKAAAAK